VRFSTVPYVPGPTGTLLLQKPLRPWARNLYRTLTAPPPEPRRGAGRSDSFGGAGRGVLPSHGRSFRCGKENGRACYPHRMTDGFFWRERTEARKTNDPRDVHETRTNRRVSSFPVPMARRHNAAVRGRVGSVGRSVEGKGIVEGCDLHYRLSCSCSTTFTQLPSATCPSQDGRENPPTARSTDGY
jgi:hypothetical protein